MRLADHSRQTLVIIGAGFSGTALACRLLRPGAWRGSIALVERSGRFGPGLAYGGLGRRAVLNVPAGEMSLDERRPNDFLDYLRSRGIDAQPQAYVARRLYGQYLETRLDEAARAGGDRQRFVRITGLATSVTRRSTDGAWRVAIDDGRKLVADRVVLALGHEAPARIPQLSQLAGTAQYVSEPWSILPSTRPAGCVLIVGTGLTMADVVCELADRTNGPRKIVAVSRRGLLSQTRGASPVTPVSPATSTIGARTVHFPSGAGLRGLVAAVRREIATNAERGRDWRETFAALRGETARLWAGLSVADKRRFLRHVQSYWDSHRHTLPPPVGATIEDLRRSGRLEIRAARIVDAELQVHGATVTLQSRGRTTPDLLEVAQVINCTGPDSRIARTRSPLVRALLESGLVTPDPAGAGVQLDAHGRPLDRTGAAVEDLYCLGPWLRARDWEATAVCELRKAATALIERLQSDLAIASTSRPALGFG